MLVRFAVGASCTVYRSPTLQGLGQLPEPAKTHRTMSLYRQALHGKNVETCKKCRGSMAEVPGPVLQKGVFKSGKPWKIQKNLWLGDFLTSTSLSMSTLAQVRLDFQRASLGISEGPSPSERDHMTIS